MKSDGWHGKGATTNQHWLKAGVLLEILEIGVQAVQEDLLTDCEWRPVGDLAGTARFTDTHPTYRHADNRRTHV